MCNFQINLGCDFDQDIYFQLLSLFYLIFLMRQIFKFINYFDFRIILGCIFERYHFDNYDDIRLKEILTFIHKSGKVIESLLCRLVVCARIICEITVFSFLSCIFPKNLISCLFRNNVRLHWSPLNGIGSKSLTFSTKFPGEMKTMATLIDPLHIHLHFGSSWYNSERTN